MIKGNYIIGISSFLKSIVPNSCKVRIGSINENQSKLATQEDSLAEGYSLNRRKEFTAGRTIAKDILTEMGVSQTPIMRDSHGCPIWPPSIVGSISHKKNLCGVLIGSEEVYKSVGFDIEITERLSSDIWLTFSTFDEIKQAEKLGIDNSLFANMLFSSKEAVFKCLFPIHNTNTPSLSQILLEVHPSSNHYSFSYKFCKTHCFGGISVDNNYTISWCLLCSG